MEVHDTAYEITFEIPGLRKEDLTISVLDDGSLSDKGNFALLSDSGKLLQIIGRTANANMDVGIARAVQLYSDADWDKGLNTTHADGRLTIRVARQTSATLPLWSTWQLQGHLPERIVLNASVQRQFRSNMGGGSTTTLSVSRKQSSKMSITKRTVVRNGFANRFRHCGG